MVFCLSRLLYYITFLFPSALVFAQFSIIFHHPIIYIYIYIYIYIIIPQTIVLDRFFIRYISSFFILPYIQILLLVLFILYPQRKQTCTFRCSPVFLSPTLHPRGFFLDCQSYQYIYLKIFDAGDIYIFAYNIYIQIKNVAAPQNQLQIFTVLNDYICLSYF